MLKPLLTFFTVLLFPFFLSAQSNYQPGYVVNIQGDTLKGYVDYRDWSMNPTSINFKVNTEDNHVQEFTTETAKAFSIIGHEYYQKFILSISNDRVNLSNLSTGIDTGSVKKNIFLRIIASGRYVTLYNYIDHLKNRFYISEVGQPTPKELIYRAYLDPQDQNNVITIKRYTNQLVALANQFGQYSEKLNEQITHAAYSAPELIKIVEKINKEKATTSYSSESKFGARFYGGIGYAFSNIKFGDSELSRLKNRISSNYPSLSLGIELFPNKNVRKLFFRVDASLTGFKANGFINNASDQPYNPYSLKYKIDLNMASISPQVIYSLYNADTFKLLLSAGPSANFSVHSKNTYTYQSTLTGYTEVKDNYLTFNQLWFSATGRIDLVIKNRYDFNFSEMLPASITNNNNSGNSKYGGYIVGISYLFGK